MIKRLTLFLTALSLQANVAVTGDTYHTISNDKVEVIYPNEYKELSGKVLDFESRLLQTYSASFGFDLDDTQYVGLLSSHNQVANAFSSQIPFNLQMNFPAGSMMVDYFAGTSWIKTLLLHESTHNFQLNPKKNMLSYYAHKVVKNSFMTWLLLGPIFPVPNLAENSFILEGNAVLNESWHNNGGRLYNGALLAMAITQAKAGYITPQRTYNNHLYFPYGTHNYVVGGFFELFLAQKYGIDKVNSYFYNFSGQWIPLFTNAVFKETFGKTFEEEIAAYQDWILSEYAGFQASQGEVLLHSKVSVALNSDADEIYFVTSNHLSAPSLIRFDKKSHQIHQQKTAHIIGKVFKEKGAYYTLGSSHTAPDNIEVGLYDRDGHLLPKSASKAVQGVMSDGRLVYFDVASSFDQPQMYVDGAFYAQVNSSVFTYHDKHYYFVQEEKTRTLYEDKKPLFSYKGWYGFVCDKDANGIYFIANSRYGSTLYRYHDKQIERMSMADDIVDARLFSTNEALVETMGAKGVTYRKISLDARPEAVTEVRYFFEDDARFKGWDFEDASSLPPAQKYHALSNLHYASLTQSVSATGNGVDFDIAANFSDVLSSNTLSLFSFKSGQKTVAGLGYDSSVYRLNFQASLFGVLDHEDNESSRGFGTHLALNYPLWQRQYEKMDVGLSYLMKDTREDKVPLTLSLAYQNHYHYGHSMYLSAAEDWRLSLGLDRADKAVGGSYYLAKELGDELYGGVDVQGAWSDAAVRGSKRGIMIEQYQNRFSDALNVEMPSIADTSYVKNVLKAGLSLRKVFNLDKYFFSFPISLRREALYGKYHYYNMELFSEKRRDFHEVTVGINADLLYFNSLALPLNVEYIHNNDLENSNNVRVLFDLRL